MSRNEITVAEVCITCYMLGLTPSRWSHFITVKTMLAINKYAT